MKKLLWGLVSILLFAAYSHAFLETSPQTEILKESGQALVSTAIPELGVTERQIDEVEMVPVYHVTRVVDGDTIEVRLGTTTEKVRLIGIDTPELRDKRELVRCFSEVAKAKTAELVGNKEVRLERDQTQDDQDKYDRLLRYVYVGDVLVNRELVAQGFAYEYTYRIPYQRQKEFKSLQTQAMEAKTGLWSDTCINK